MDTIEAMVADPSQLRLKPLDAPDLPRFIEVPDGGLTLGRDASSDIVLDSERYPYTSALHARLDRQGSDLVLEDLDSKNGTLVNGHEVQQSPVKAGDVIQLGKDVGARFLVVAGVSVPQTLDLQRDAALPDPGRQHFSASTILRLKNALGIRDRTAEIGEMARSNKRRIAVNLTVLVLLAGGVIYGFLHVVQSQKDLGESQKQRLAALEGQLLQADRGLGEQQRRWEAQKKELEDQRRELNRQLKALQDSDQVSAGRIDDLRHRLGETDERLEKFNPINLEELERSRRKTLEGVLSSIVYIEKKIAFREKDGEKYLHAAESPGPRLRELEKIEELHFDASESGSGFCVAANGWVVTNAHVVQVPTLSRPLRFDETVLVMEPFLDVIFSGTSRRHSAKVVAVSSDGTDDFAVLKIEPFENMPHIRGFDPDAPLPEQGSTVRLFGFPLGRMLLQKEDTFSASVFAGIVSRRIEPFIQVQAAVYPGNSGGPVVDEDGRVIGIVTGVQTTPAGQIASDIGYVLPIAGLRSMWPPGEK